MAVTLLSGSHAHKIVYNHAVRGHRDLDLAQCGGNLYRVSATVKTGHNRAGLREMALQLVCGNNRNYRSTT